MIFFKLNTTYSRTFQSMAEKKSNYLVGIIAKNGVNPMYVGEKTIPSNFTLLVQIIMEICYEILFKGSISKFPKISMSEFPTVPIPESPKISRKVKKGEEFTEKIIGEPPIIDIPEKDLKEFKELQNAERSPIQHSPKFKSFAEMALKLVEVKNKKAEFKPEKFAETKPGNSKYIYADLKRFIVNPSVEYYFIWKNMLISNQFLNAKIENGHRFWFGWGLISIEITCEKLEK